MLEKLYSSSTFFLNVALCFILLNVEMNEMIILIDLSF